MKDVISGVSGLVALIVVISCILNGHSLESTLLRTLVSFVVSNFIGYAAFGLSVVTMYRANTVNNTEVSSTEPITESATEA